MGFVWGYLGFVWGCLGLSGVCLGLFGAAPGAMSAERPWVQHWEKKGGLRWELVDARWGKILGGKRGFRVDREGFGVGKGDLGWENGNEVGNWGGKGRFRHWKRDLGTDKRCGEEKGEFVMRKGGFRVGKEGFGVKKTLGIKSDFGEKKEGFGIKKEDLGVKKDLG